MKLTTAYSSSDYPHFYAPIVYHCTAQAKLESNPTVAFSLADFSDAVVTILSRGMQIITDVAIGGGEGLVSSIKTVLTPQHWVDLAKSIPLFLMHSIVFLSNEYAQLESIDQALMIGDNDLFMKRCGDYEEQCRLRMKSLEEGLTHVASLSWRDLAHHATYFGTTIALDCVELHALKLAASPTGRELVGNIVQVFRSPRASQTMAEVAGVGKIAIEEGIESAHKVTEIIKGNQNIAASTGKALAQATQEVDTLLKAGNILDKGGLTTAGRALQKHGSRAQSVFPKATGNAAVINAQGETVLKEILTNPNVSSVIRHHARFGNILEYRILEGKGARFSSDGKTFIGFIEP